jgi:hypothetical protein
MVGLCEVDGFTALTLPRPDARIEGPRRRTVPIIDLLRPTLVWLTTARRPVE